MEYPAVLKFLHLLKSSISAKLLNLIIEMMGGYSEIKNTDAKVEGMVKQCSAQIMAMVSVKDGEWDAKCTEPQQKIGTCDTPEGKDCKTGKECGSTEMKECTEGQAKAMGMSIQECKAMIAEKGYCAPESKDGMKKGKDMTGTDKEMGMDKRGDTKMKAEGSKEGTDLKKSPDTKTMGSGMTSGSHGSTEAHGSEGPKGMHKDGMGTDGSKPTGMPTSGMKGMQMKVLSYQTQVVNGTNYKIKLTIGDQQYECIIYENLPANGGKCEVTSVVPCN
jgi:hypothetical protein